VGRGWIEMMRTDTANHILGLRVNVWTSILLFLAAVVYYVLAAKRGPREAPELLVSKDAAVTPEAPDDAPSADEADSVKVPAEAEKPVEDAPVVEEPKKTDES
jgi:hypothetical protein